LEEKEYTDYLARWGLKADEWTFMELLAVATAREMAGTTFAFIGTGLPLLAASLAQRTVAPDLTIILESGIVGPEIHHLPISVADPRAAYHAATLSTMVDVFGLACRGFCTLGVLGAAECDQYGNLNSTALGGYWQTGKNRHLRLAGSGGANSIASLADRIIVTMVHEKRRFTATVQYLSSVAGRRVSASEDRHSFGLFRGGNITVISDLGVLRPHPKTGVLVLDTYYPGVDPEFIKANTGWDLSISQAVPLPPPTREELRILRLEVDPNRFYLGRQAKRKNAGMATG